MKNLLLLLVVFSGLLSSCSKKDDPQPDVDHSVYYGTWYVDSISTTTNGVSLSPAVVYQSSSDFIRLTEDSVEYHYSSSIVKQKIFWDSEGYFIRDASLRTGEQHFSCTIKGSELVRVFNLDDNAPYPTNQKEFTYCHK